MSMCISVYSTSSRQDFAKVQACVQVYPLSNCWLSGTAETRSYFSEYSAVRVGTLPFLAALCYIEWSGVLRDAHKAFSIPTHGCRSPPNPKVI